MNAQREPLGGFEERLLSELRRVVEASPEPATTPPLAPERRSLLRRPLALAGGVAGAAAATLVAVFAIGGGGESDAWAVTSNGDGTVTVEINSLSDAEGLERKLHATGLPAVVDYERAAATCAAARYALPVSPGGKVRTEEYGLRAAPAGASDHGLDRAGRPPQGGTKSAPPDPADGSFMAMRVNGGGAEFTLSKDVPDDATLVITTKRLKPTAVEGAAISVLYAKADAQGCKIEPPR